MRKLKLEKSHLPSIIAGLQAGIWQMWKRDHRSGSGRKGIGTRAKKAVLVEFTRSKIGKALLLSAVIDDVENPFCILERNLRRQISIGRGIIKNSQRLSTIKKRGFALRNQLAGAQKLHCNRGSIANKKAPAELCGYSRCGTASGKQIAHEIAGARRGKDDPAQKGFRLLRAKPGAFRVALMQMFHIIPNIAGKNRSIFRISIGFPTGTDGKANAAMRIYASFHVVALFRAARDAHGSDVKVYGFGFAVK